MKDLDSKNKQFAFDVIRTGEPADRCKERGNMVNMTGWQNDPAAILWMDEVPFLNSGERNVGEIKM